ncbi:MAG: hypothetical protein IPK87_01805 [Planctomycetes bacterium]|nr:hypothetical protein [Planctomycetota bacterium]
MTIGFPAFHEEMWRPRWPIDANRVLAASQQLGWSFFVEHYGPVGFRWKLGTGMSFWSWGETVIVEPQPDNTVRVHSSCALVTQFLDFGRNRRNVEKLAETMGV